MYRDIRFAESAISLRYYLRSYDPIMQSSAGTGPLPVVHDRTAVHVVRPERCRARWLAGYYNWQGAEKVYRNAVTSLCLIQRTHFPPKTTTITIWLRSIAVLHITSYIKHNCLTIV